MKMFLFLIAFLFAAPSFAGFQGYNSTSDLKGFNKLQCSTGIVCSKSADKMQISTVGGLQNRVAATATTITSAQCGSTFYNSGAVEMELPEASTVLGCRLTFVVANASNFHIDPDDADIILNSTNAAGDRALNATLGGTITLEAVSATHWVVVGSSGTWTDAN